MNPTLKELLKPPFCRGRGIDSHFRVFMDGSTSPLVTVNYANFRNRKKEEILFDDFCNFVPQALNEKWERDFGEPLRWRYAHIDMLCGRLVCPKCDRTVLIFNDYCPHCGQRLLPPEEALDGRKDKAL